MPETNHETTISQSPTIRFAAVGDLLLTTRPGATTPGRGLEALSDKVRQLFKSYDVVLANLECTLPGGIPVATEPRVFASEAQVHSLAGSGINTVTLANNHAFDGGDEGFKKLTNLLNRQNIAWFGAGLNLSEAGRPCILNHNNIRIAVIGAVDASSGMHRYATSDSSGVAPFVTESLCRQIESLKDQADHLIVSPHWGEERFRFPSPAQVEQAHAFIDAGASMVLGHHPHVVQGMEIYKTRPIIYSLGNFLANHVYWDSGDFLTWNRFERTGCILLAELDKHSVKSVKQLSVHDNEIIIDLDNTKPGKRYLQNANIMLSKIAAGRYSRENFRVRVLLPIRRQLRRDKLMRFRPSHIAKAFRLLFK